MARKLLLSNLLKRPKPRESAPATASNVPFEITPTKEFHWKHSERSTKRILREEMREEIVTQVEIEAGKRLEEIPMPEMAHLIVTAMEAEKIKGDMRPEMRNIVEKEAGKNLDELKLREINDVLARIIQNFKNPETN